MEETLVSQYTHGNRAFLQALMARGTLTFHEARPIIAAILTAASNNRDEYRPDQISEEKFLDFIDAASKATSLFDYEVRSTLHQTTKQRIYALVNTTSDPQTQLATIFSPDELSFIKRVLEAMFDTYNTPRMEIMAITQMQAIKLARPPPNQTRATSEDADGTQAQNTDRGLKHSEVEEVLANLVNGGWFEKSRQKYYGLTPRGLMELRPWLTETFNDPDAEPNEWQRIKICEACKDLITMGLRCSEPECTFRIHDMCQDAFWRTRGAIKCAKCSREWTGDRYVGERAVTHTESYQRGGRRSGADGVGGGDGGRRRTGREVDLDDE